MSLSLPDVLVQLSNALAAVDPADLPDSLALSATHTIYPGLPELEITIDTQQVPDAAPSVRMRRECNRSLLGLDRGLFWECGTSETTWRITAVNLTPAETITTLNSDVFLCAHTQLTNNVALQ